jgi:uncharacterized protein Usg
VVARRDCLLIGMLSKHSAGPMERKMVSKDFIRQLSGYGLTTATILYRMPDHPVVLQSFIWQEYDVAPRFPVLKDFLAFWGRELEGPLHSVTVAHSRLIRPAEIRNLDSIFTLH